MSDSARYLVLAGVIIVASLVLARLALVDPTDWYKVMGPWVAAHQP